jgi:ribose-phosphate pyrophosphokinase
MYVLEEPTFPETTAKKHEVIPIKFPDGHQHVKYDGPNGTVVASIKNMDDVFTACQLARIIQKRFNYLPDLVCPWLFSLRCDRSFSEFEVEDRDIVLRTLQVYFPNIYIHCPHSKGNYDYNEIDELGLFSRAAQRIEADTIVLPDEGATKRFRIDAIKALCRSDSGFEPNIVVCSKVRDVSTGQLSGFKIESGKVGKRCLIIDDICDGGGTFVGIQKILREAGAQEVYLSVYHGIFSKGRVEGIDGVYTTNSYTTPEMVEALNKDWVWCVVRKVW